MICPKCGLINADMAVYCNYCGNRLQSTDKQQPQEQKSAVSQQSPGYSPPPPRKNNKGNMVMLIIGIVGITAALFTVLYLTVLKDAFSSGVNVNSVNSPINTGIVQTPQESPDISSTPTEQPTEVPTITPTITAAPEPEFAVSISSLKRKDDLYDVDADYPIILGMKDTSFQTKLNRDIVEDMLERIEHLHQEAENAYSPSGFNLFTLDSGVVEYYKDANLLSVGIRMSCYEGGAFDNPYSVFYTVLNYDPGKCLLMVEDIFTDRAEGTKRINSAIKAAIGGSTDYVFSSVGAVDNGFYITKTELVVVFQPSVIGGPDSTKESEFRIPLASLKDILIPQIAKLA